MSPTDSHDDERFRRIKLLFGTMDDLGQERRRAWTEWVTGKLDAPRFAEMMRANLGRTRETADSLEKLL